MTTTLAAIGDPRLPARFWSKVEPVPSGCWTWTASRTNLGYGKFRVGDRIKSAHRVAYEALVGPIPEGLTLDHLCRVRHCVRPDHAEPVRQRTNVLRGEGVAAVNARRTTCRRKGHPLSGDNLYVKPSTGQRECRTCRDEQRVR